jgi:hypothetical protein
MPAMLLIGNPEKHRGHGPLLQGYGYIGSVTPS